MIPNFERGKPDSLQEGALIIQRREGGRFGQVKKEPGKKEEGKSGGAGQKLGKPKNRKELDVWEKKKLSQTKKGTGTPCAEGET